MQKRHDEAGAGDIEAFFRGYDRGGGEAREGRGINGRPVERPALPGDTALALGGVGWDCCSILFDSCGARVFLNWFP